MNLWGVSMTMWVPNPDRWYVPCTTFRRLTVTMQVIPTQRGDFIRGLILDGDAPRGLLSEAVLGIPEDVCAALSAAYVLQHPLVSVRHGEHRTPSGGRDRFNVRTPVSVFQLNVNGKGRRGGGQRLRRRQRRPSHSP